MFIIVVDGIGTLGFVILLIFCDTCDVWIIINIQYYEQIMVLIVTRVGKNNVCSGKKAQVYNKNLLCK